MVYELQGTIRGRVDCTPAKLNAIKTALEAVFGPITRIKAGLWASEHGEVEIRLYSLRNVTTTVTDVEVDP